MQPCSHAALFSYGNEAGAPPGASAVRRAAPTACPRRRQGAASFESGFTAAEALALTAPAVPEFLERASVSPGSLAGNPARARAAALADSPAPALAVDRAGNPGLAPVAVRAENPVRAPVADRGANREGFQVVSVQWTCGMNARTRQVVHQTEAKAALRPIR